ncbi:DUF3291 domain-containing protein [Ktedonosporobacter rubrisoli]|nr:DUF3291 domain-containing protein [Ktedonosporobacter rubrisoli]
MYHLAQVNIGRLRAPLNDPGMAGYVALRPVIDALARKSQGFIWRRGGPGSTAKETDLYEDHMLIANVSVWATLEDYVNFVYKSEHLKVIKQGQQWFQAIDGPHYALWWVPQGHQPSAQEARERLEYLGRHGETAYAFSIEKTFWAPGEDTLGASLMG